MANSNFDLNTADLGTNNMYDRGGSSRLDVSDSLYASTLANTRTNCYVCGNKGHYRVLAKDPKYDRADLQNGLYICKNCLAGQPFNPDHYGIRPLE